MRKRFFLIAFLVLLTLLLIGPFLIPVPPLQDTLPPRQLADPDSRFITVNGLDVHYKMAGQGEPVFILLHGFGASVFTWHKVMPELSRYGTVIAYDRPAFGLTERPLTWEGTNPYSPDAQIDLLFGLMDSLGIERAILVGNSAGGTVALRSALARPERVQAVVAVDAAVYVGGGAPAWIRPLLQTPQMRHLGPLLVRRIATDGNQLIRQAWHDPDKIDAATWEGYRKPLRAENWDRALWELTLSSRDSDLADRLNEITMPVLVLTGDDDRLVPTEQSVRLARELPNSRLVIFANCGHLPQEECPQDFLKAFIEALPFLNAQ
ncbi:MAG: alpha/beta hydrolase [Anaerolineales bacterium]